MLATMADAHAEWHRNTGIPMGLPGCPPDACHTDYMDDAEVRRLVRQRDINWALMRGEEGDATIRCPHCYGVHLAVAYVRACAALTDPRNSPEPRPEAEAAARAADSQWSWDYQNRWGRAENE